MNTRRTTAPKSYKVTNARKIAADVRIFHLGDAEYFEGDVVNDGDLKVAQISWLVEQGLLVEVKHGG